MIAILDWYKGDFILQGFKEIFPEFEYPLSAKFTKSYFSKLFLQWVAAVSSSTTTLEDSISMATTEQPEETQDVGYVPPPAAAAPSGEDEGTMMMA